MKVYIKISCLRGLSAVDPLSQSGKCTPYCNARPGYWQSTRKTQFELINIRPSQDYISKDHQTCDNNNAVQGSTSTPGRTDDKDFEERLVDCLLSSINWEVLPLRTEHTVHQKKKP